MRLVVTEKHYVLFSSLEVGEMDFVKDAGCYRRKDLAVRRECVTVIVRIGVGKVDHIVQRQRLGKEPGYLRAF